MNSYRRTAYLWKSNHGTSCHEDFVMRPQRNYKKWLILPLWSQTMILWGHRISSYMCQSTIFHPANIYFSYRSRILLLKLAWSLANETLLFLSWSDRFNGSFHRIEIEIRTKICFHYQYEIQISTKLAQIWVSRIEITRKMSMNGWRAAIK